MSDSPTSKSKKSQSPKKNRLEGIDFQNSSDCKQINNNNSTLGASDVASQKWEEQEEFEDLNMLSPRICERNGIILKSKQENRQKLPVFDT